MYKVTIMIDNISNTQHQLFTKVDEIACICNLSNLTARWLWEASTLRPV